MADQDIYSLSAWQEYRRACDDRRKWFDGTNLAKVIRGGGRDPFTQEFPELFPLRINPVAVFATTHQAVMCGVQPDTIESPMRVIVKRAGLTPEQSAQADDLERLLLRVFKDGSGLASIAEAALMLQYYGGHVFQASWDPENSNYRHGIGIVSHDDPSRLWPTVWSPDRRTIVECYVGYKISPDTARKLYNVVTSDQDVLYLEYWTPDRYWIHVNDRVIADEVNPWGKVPIVYIPHTKSGGFFGKGIVDGPGDLRGLIREMNSRTADLGEIVQDSRPLPFVRNVQGSIQSRPISRPGQPELDAIDLGNKTPMASAGDPELGFAQSKGLPESVARFPDELWELLLMQSNVAPVALGRDDVSGGRITGPVTAYRMLPSLHHTQYERALFSQGMVQLAEIVIEMARSKANAYEQYPNLTAPTIPEWPFEFTVQWRPSIPIEEMQRIEQLNARLAAGGISVLTYLTQLGHQDPEQEADRIWEDRERIAQIEAEAQAVAMAARFGMQGDRSNGNGRQEAEPVQGQRQQSDR